MEELSVRGGSDIGVPDLPEVRAKTIRGRFELVELAEPDSSGFIVGVEGKSCNDRL